MSTAVDMQAPAQTDQRKDRFKTIQRDKACSTTPPAHQFRPHQNMHTNFPATYAQQQSLSRKTVDHVAIMIHAR